MRASLAANGQSALAGLRRCRQAGGALPRCPAAYPVRQVAAEGALSSVSAMFSHEPCWGVWRIASRSATRLAASGANTWESEAGENGDRELVLCQSCSDAFKADLLPRGLAGGGGGEAVPGDADGRGA